jgi:hypothetical protein
MIVFVLYVFSLLIVQGLTEYLLTEVPFHYPKKRSGGCFSFGREKRLEIMEP